MKGPMASRCMGVGVLIPTVSHTVWIHLEHPSETKSSFPVLGTASTFRTDACSRCFGSSVATSSLLLFWRAREENSFITSDKKNLERFSKIFE